MRLFITVVSIFALAACGDDTDENPPPGSGEGVVLMCSDAASADNQDGDGDGYTPCDGDCDDTDPAFHPEADDVPDDRIDHDCDNWMPERA